MAKELYWLGPGVFTYKHGREPIRPDDKLHKAALERLGPERIKKLKAKGTIGDAPKSAHLIRAERNAKNAVKNLGKDKAELLKKVNKLESENSDLEAENAKLKAKNKELQNLDYQNIKLEKAFSAAMKVEGKLKKQIENLKTKFKKKGKNA